MLMTREKPPLTPEEKAEKRRLFELFEKSKPGWQARHNGTRLTQALLGEVVGEMVNGEPMTQGAIWQYLKAEHNTKLNPPIVQAIAAVCGFDPKLVSPKYEPKDWLKAAIQDSRPMPFDQVTPAQSDDDIVDAVTRWASELNPKLAMKLVQVLLSRASAEL